MSIGRSDLDWVRCPICDAGSPAGISICPRCRYQFRIRADNDTPEFEPSPTPREVHPKLRASGQFTLGMASLVVAALAVVTAWPILIFPTCSALLILLLHRAGFSPVRILIIIAIIGFVLGLVLPPVVMHCRLGTAPTSRLLKPPEPK
jgi:hypothetical protein